MNNVIFKLYKNVLFLDVYDVFSSGETYFSSWDFIVSYYIHYSTTKH